MITTFYIKLTWRKDDNGSNIPWTIYVSGAIILVHLGEQNIHLVNSCHLKTEIPRWNEYIFTILLVTQWNKLKLSHVGL